MTDALFVFAAQYLYVLLLGLQSLNVNTGHRVLAMTTSFLLGIGGFYLTATVGKAATTMGTEVWWGFVLAGPLGIATSMMVHPRLVEFYSRRFK